MTSVGNMVLLLSVLIVLFAAAGMTMTSQIVGDYMDNFENFKAGNLFDSLNDVLVSLLGLGAIAGIVIGTASPERGQWILLVSYTVLLGVFAADFVSIYRQLADEATWIKLIANVIFIPLTAMYIHSVMSWWGQRS